MLPSLLAACLVLLAGGMVAQHVPFLARYSIPAPIVGGLMFAGIALLAEWTAGLGITFDTSAKTPFLVLFFASIGLTADLALLRRGGPRLLRFLLALFPFLIAQDALGVVMARLLGLHPVLGLVAGSITLVGGHGTGAAYAERFADEHDILGVMGLTMTSATIGLILGGVIGGPVAERLVWRIARLEAASPAPDGGVVGGPVSTLVTAMSLVAALAAALAAVIAAQALGSALEGGSVIVPSFLWSLIIGLIIRNGASAVGERLHDAAAELIGGLPFAVFDVDDDDPASGRRLPDGRAIADHPCCSDGAGRRLGELGDISGCRSRLRERDHGRSLLRFCDGGHGNRNREYAGADPPPRTGPTGFCGCSDGRGVFCRSDEPSRVDILSVAWGDSGQRMKGG
jgi:sodium--glutamate symport carrier gltS